ncbi:hypothetical protein LXL04_018418 [Taraxacum kok-saghyz]
MGKRKKSAVHEENIEEEDEQQQETRGESSSSSNTTSLYEILGVEKTASQQEIKKAYHKLALRLHPDKNPNDEDAKEKFQQLQKVISILGDEEKRALYDQTGCVDDAELAGDVAQNLKNFFRTMYKKVTEADIEEFESNYRGSESEKNDLIELYTKYKGHMNRLFCSMLCSDPKLDSHRFKDILDEAISSGEVKLTKAYKKWANKVSETKPPTDPLKRSGNSKKESDDLYAIISQRQSERKGRLDAMFSSLVGKYGGERGESSEPTEEEFEAARVKLEKRKSSKKSKKSNKESLKDEFHRPFRPPLSTTHCRRAVTSIHTLIIVIFSSLASSVSAQEVAMSPAPSPAAGAASSLPIPGILVGFAFILSALAQLRN